MRLTFASTLTAADSGRRIIAGRIVTFGEVGNTSAGPTVFEAGSITFPDDVVLVLEHDTTHPIGRAVELSETPAGIEGTFRVVGTRAGDDALVEAAERLRDGFSVGVDVTAHQVDTDGTLRITAASLDHVGLVTRPAIDSARVDRVAASETPSEEGNPEMTDTTVEVAESETVEVIEASAPVLAPIRTAPRVAPFADAADYINTFVAASRGDRAAGTRIEAANTALADVPGIVPTPIVGPVIDTLNASRPVVAASRSVGMPAAGSTFTRPYIKTHSAVGGQTAEFAPITSTTMEVDPLTVTKSTRGGSVSISFQNRDWTDPAILNLAVADLAKAYAVDTETKACTDLVAGVTQTQDLDSAADSGAFITALYGAAAKVNTGCGDLPDAIFASPDQWARLGSLVDASKRPLFPSMGPVNAMGTMQANTFVTNPLGLRLVVSNRLAVGTLMVGRSEYFETYETVGGNLSVTNVSTLSFDLAYYGYFADLVTVPLAFCKLVDPTPLAAKAK